MKKTVQKEVEFCDFCGKEAGYYHCLKCGKDFCFDCQKAKAATYRHSVRSEGSMDGIYCHDCNNKIMAGDGDGENLFMAYLGIANLSKEYKIFTESFNPRRIAAEEKLEILWRNQHRESTNRKT